MKFRVLESCVFANSYLFSRRLGKEKKNTKHARAYLQKRNNKEKKKKKKRGFVLVKSREEREREREKKKKKKEEEKGSSLVVSIFSLSLSLSLSLCLTPGERVHVFSLCANAFLLLDFLYINTYKREGERVRVCARAC